MKRKIKKWTIVGSEVGKECTDDNPTGDTQRFVNLEMMEIASDMNWPLLLTTDSHMVDPEMKFIQDILLQNGNPDGWRFTEAYHQMTTEQAWDLWSGRLDMGEYASEFKEAVENNEVLASMVGDIGISKQIRLPTVNVPREIKQRFPEDRDSQYLKMIALLIKEHGRLPKGNEEYVRRLEEEIEVIANNGTINFLPYFIFVEDVCRKARAAGEETGPGRGSAAGCLLAYLLKITHIDPIRWGLSFYRFLSKARIDRRKFPDIDIDFANPGLVAEIMKSEIGDRFMRICTLGTIQGRSAIREVSRVVLSTKTDPEAAEEVDVAAKALPYTPQGVGNSKEWIFGHTDEMDVYHPGAIDSCPDVKEFFDRHPDVKRGVEEVLNIPKMIGRHAAAYAAADVPIADVVPICRINGEECTQYPKDPIEDLGLIKMDLLGLNTLKDIRGAVSWIGRLRGKNIDIYDIPLDDKKTWQAFHDGRNETVFQFNKPIGVDLSKKYKPTSILDLAQMTAAGRPGTLFALMPDGETTLVDQWVGVRSGEKDPSFVHPSVESILEPTGGVCLFQEQITEMFQVACGYSEEEADEIREVVGKKKKDRMDALIPEIRKRLLDGGWSEAQAESFISLCNAASSYSFNKSHSLAYSYLGYVCQYLKENYPVEWWASALQNSSKDDLRANARFCSKYISPPDILTSEVEVFVADKIGRSDKGRIVFPLSMVHGVKSAAEAIVDARPFSTLEELFQKVDRKKVNKRVFSALIWSGAMDRMFGIPPQDSIKRRNDIYRRYLEIKGEKHDDFVDLTEIEVMKAQGQAFPMIEPDYAAYLSVQEERNIQCASTVSHRASGSRTTIGGVIREIRKIVTKKGDEMSFILVANTDSAASVTLFPELHSESSDFMKEGDLVVVKGQIQDFRGKRSLVADKINFPERDK